MEKWMLTVGYDKEKFNEAQREYLKYGIFIRMATDTPAAVEELTKQNHFLLVIIFYDGPDYLAPLTTLAYRDIFVCVEYSERSSNALWVPCQQGAR